MDIKYAVESAHDANIIQHVNSQYKESSFSNLMAMLSLEPHSDEDNCDCDEETLRLRRQFRLIKSDVDALDPTDKLFYQKKELLIYKTFCEVRGIYVQDLQEYVEEIEQDLQEYAEENE